MKVILQDVLTALLLGLVLPGIVLNLTAEPRGEPPQPTSPETTVPTGETMTLDGAEMDLETYLLGVVLAEMPAEFEPEALKAQSVAARTYTQKALQATGKHDGALCSDPGCCQAYIAPEAYLARGGTRENLEKVRLAVDATAPLVLTYEGALIEATYFSCSGGRTEEAVAVWGAEFPYLQSVESPGEELAPYDSDTVTLSRAQFESALGLTLTGEPGSWIGTVTFTQGGGVAEMEICGTVFTGTQLRSRLNLRSTAMTILPEGETVTIETRGYGHRVGMSQYGAEAMALSGSDFRQILAHYYPGTELTHGIRMGNVIAFVSS